MKRKSNVNTVKKSVPLFAKQQDCAVALAYNAITDSAPLVLSVGRNDDTIKMKRLARRYGVPIKKSKEVSQKLSCLEVNQGIPEELYVDIAKILVDLKR